MQQAVTVMCNALVGVAPLAGVSTNPKKIPAVTGTNLGLSLVYPTTIDVL